MRVTVVAPPAPFVSWDDLDTHLHLGGDDSEKAYIELLAAAASGHLDGPEGWLGRAIGRQTLEARCNGFPCDDLKLPFPEIESIVSVKYIDAAGAEQTIDANDYALAGRVLSPAWGKVWPSPRSGNDTVRIRYLSGYETVPAAIKSAVLTMVADMYRSRESFAGGTITEVPMSITVADRLQPFRVYR